MNEITRFNLETMYKKYNASFKDLSFSRDLNKSCVESEERAINGDELKNNCCKEYKHIKSVDAISFNKKQSNFIFIEFKIRNRKTFQDQKRFKRLVMELKQKFSNSWDCFQHNIDQEHIYQKQKQEKIFVYKISNVFRETRTYFNPIKTALKQFNINVISARTFEEQISNYKYDI